MNNLRKKVLGGLFLFSSSFAFAQNPGQISGNFQVDFQVYQPDSLIGAEEVPEGLLMNGFANVNYTRDEFSAGLRYESYLNPMLGFDTRYKGSGITYRYASYDNGFIKATIGNFYDQFGSGLLLRAYEERNLGYDNAFDGFHIAVNPGKGVRLKALIGKQRAFFDYSNGIVRGFDGEWVLNEGLKSMETSATTVIVGGSFVSKFQADQDPFYKLPENVAAGSGRLNIIRGGFDFFTEYAYKINDPSAANGFIYKPGEALLVTASYSRKGMGIILGAKRIDNMDFRSDRTATGNVLLINYLPALTKQHTYTIAAFYPYATQPNGELGVQGELFYTFKKGSFLGGKYGTKLSVNLSAAQSIERSPIHDTIAVGESGTLGYESEFLTPGETVYFRDFNFTLTKKFSKKWKGSFMYMNQSYNKAVIEGKPGFLKNQILVAEAQYKINTRHSIRMEAQGLFMEDDANPDNVDFGSWALGLVEYTVAPHYFVAVQDLYNYGNPDKTRRIHYFLASAGYVKGSSRIALNYGKQRAGIFCVGGICREVPASSGLSVSITSSF